MSTAVESSRKGTRLPTLTDLSSRFGAMPSWRIRTTPAPGTATEKDVLHAIDHDGRLCELVDGILVEKDAGCEESELAFALGLHLGNYVTAHKLGRMRGADGPMRLKLGLVRIPDLAFVSRDRYPGGKPPKGAISKVVPNLVVEVLSRGNTSQEMQLKLREYFDAGVELVWIVDPLSRQVEVFTTRTRSTVLTETQTLTGGKVLPGFKLKLPTLFATLDE